MYFRKKKSVIPANKFGKMATVLFSIAVSLMILLPGQPFTMAIMIIALISKLISFSSYVIKYFKKHFVAKQ
jgi:cardiolipin synthase